MNQANNSVAMYELMMDTLEQEKAPDGRQLMTDCSFRHMQGVLHQMQRRLGVNTGPWVDIHGEGSFSKNRAEYRIKMGRGSTVDRLLAA